MSKNIRYSSVSLNRVHIVYFFILGTGCLGKSLDSHWHLLEQVSLHPLSEREDMYRLPVALFLVPVECFHIQSLSQRLFSHSS